MDYLSLYRPRPNETATVTISFTFKKHHTMQQTFSHEFMLQNRGCYSLEQLLGCSFMNGTVTLRAIVNSEISLQDKYWFVCQKLATKAENQQIARRSENN